ncbi:MAG TPA: hypothetical protein VF988_04415, partial [Verrucomicrobiae bacterium]
NIGGSITVRSGGTLAPGTNGSSIGRLTCGNNVTLAGATRMKLNKTAFTNDTVSVSGTLTYGGALLVTNLGGTLTQGDSFALFSAGSPTGSFGATNLPALGAGLAWNFNAGNGVLSVISTVATNATSLSNSVSSGALTLSWPADHTGWRLQVQTNSLTAGLSGNWVDVPGSTLTNNFVVPLDAAQGSVFYRLIYP